eukprot:TRINITY_DN2451_c0_g2_i1.p1 TRINITY_DN2451_c0_g2~~TRINITY_DN2451_c0_g2_i1.p1  ORF type:complete len:278 (+),score=46.96 TRINITY_DN2451_c0_g2_i1:521-1354(+)
MWSWECMPTRIILCWRCFGGTSTRCWCAKTTCPSTPVALEASITPDTGSNVDGVGAIYINGRLCVRKALHQPVAVTRTSNLIETSNWDRTSVIDGKVNSLDISSCPLPRQYPCANMEQVRSTWIRFNSKQAPLTFGGGFYAKARVIFYSHKPLVRIFDFGNGIAKDNVVLGVHADTNHLVLEVFRGNVHQMLVCEDDVPLHTRVTVEVVVTPVTGSNVDGVGAIYINGKVCVSNPLHQPVAVTRISNYIGTSNLVSRSTIHGTVFSLDISPCALPTG